MVCHQQSRRDHEAGRKRSGLSTGHIDPNASDRAADAQSFVQKRHAHEIVCAEDAFESRLGRKTLRLARHHRGWLIDYQLFFDVESQPTSIQKFLNTIRAVYVEIALLGNEPLIARALRLPFCVTLLRLVQLKLAEQHRGLPHKYSVPSLLLIECSTTSGSMKRNNPTITGIPRSGCSS